MHLFLTLGRYPIRQQMLGLGQAYMQVLELEPEHPPTRLTRALLPGQAPALEQAPG